MNCDVLVVGAGPAGSMAAKTAAEHGMDVILIERNGEIGVPVRCAEGVNNFITQNTGVLMEPSFVKKRIEGTKIYFYGETYNLDTKKWGGYTLDRKVFDKHLASLAEKAGANVFTNTTALKVEKRGGQREMLVRGIDGEHKIKAKVIIGADGFECNVGRMCGIGRPWRLDEFVKGYELVLSGVSLADDDIWHICFGKEFPNGYAWIFPKGNKIANVGVALDPQGDALNALKFFMEEYPGITDMLGGDYDIVEVRGGGIPICGPKPIEKTVADGLILVGDAAGIVEPITGEGICPGMLSGIAAGETASECIRTGTWGMKSLRVYADRWRDKRYAGNFRLGEDIDLFTRVRRQFYNTFSNKGGGGVARKRAVDALLGDDTTTTELRMSSLNPKNLLN